MAYVRGFSQTFKNEKDFAKCFGQFSEPCLQLMDQSIQIQELILVHSHEISKRDTIELFTIDELKLC